jgi:hypothetical protein
MVKVVASLWSLDCIVHKGVVVVSRVAQAGLPVETAWFVVAAPL